MKKILIFCVSFSSVFFSYSIEQYVTISFDHVMVELRNGGVAPLKRVRNVLGKLEPFIEDQKVGEVLENIIKKESFLIVAPYYLKFIKAGILNRYTNGFVSPEIADIVESVLPEKPEHFLVLPFCHKVIEGLFCKKLRSIKIPRERFQRCMSELSSLKRNNQDGFVEKYRLAYSSESDLDIFDRAIYIAAIRKSKKGIYSIVDPTGKWQDESRK